MTHQRLGPLAGCWQVKGFVDPEDYDSLLYPPGINPPECLKGSIIKDEVVRLVPSDDPRVLWGVYVADISKTFWVALREKPEHVVIKAHGELHNRGSYKLVMSTTSKSRNPLCWESMRHEQVEEHHVIKWVRYNVKSVPSQVLQLHAPAVPRSLRKRVGGGHTRVCACGSNHDHDASIGAFVTIRRPKLTKQELSRNLASGDRRIRESAVVKLARYHAYWLPWAGKEEVRANGTAFVHTSHMHDVARVAWLRAKTQQKNFQLRGFSLPEEKVQMLVKPDLIHKHYHLVVGEKNVYLPKLNVMPPSNVMTRSGQVKRRRDHKIPDPQFATVEKVKRSRIHGPTIGAAVRQPLCRDDTTAHQPSGKRNLDSQQLPGTDAIATLNAEIRRLNALVTEHRLQQQEGREQARSSSAPQAPEFRLFFTQRGHCHYQKRFWTLKWWFGLTNDWDAFVVWITCFHSESRNNRLKETHSQNEQRAPLTDFEQCLLTKAYVRTLCAVSSLPVP